MTRNRLVPVLLLLVVAAGAYWMLLLSPRRAELATTRDAIATAQARRDVAVAAAATAQSARAAYQRDYATLARLGKAAPPDDDVASLVYQLETLAHANNVDFRALRLAAGSGTPAPVATPAPAAGASKDATGAKDTTATGTAAKDASATDSSASATPATPVAPAVAQAPPGAVIGSAGLITLPFTFTFDGGYLPMQRMLGAVDRLADTTGGTINVRGRLLTVDGFALTASRLGFPKVQAVVSATAYIVPAAAGITPGASAPGAAAGSAAAPAQAGSGSGSPATVTATATPVTVG
jgi:hypothetical protein